MLFNSYEFIFLFFPLVLAVYFLLGKYEKHALANLSLIIFSLIFYAYWNISFLPLLLTSIIVNFSIYKGIVFFKNREEKLKSKLTFYFGILFNLGLLGYFKYFNFFLESLNDLGANFEISAIILPLGISFFSITQLLFLWDAYASEVKETNLLNYSLFVTFFPHLLAGPILYHYQMIKQFNDSSLCKIKWQNFSKGFTLFIIGLMKKTMIADALSPYVNYGFSHTDEITLVTAWIISISYMLELYFDFSGYSDMAVGLAKMMNFNIPINFNAPFRATNMINFWQKWHISLTNALTAAIYMPIIRKVKKPTLKRTIFAASITMFLVGIWHGAGWTYVIFALLNALTVAINYLWRETKINMPKFLAHTLTLLTILFTMVFFRAESVTDALNVFYAMFGYNGIIFADSFFVIKGGLPQLNLPIENAPGIFFQLALISAILVTIFSPSSNDLIKKFKPNIYWLLFTGIGFFLSFLAMTKPTEFLYFQF